MSGALRTRLDPATYRDDVACEVRLEADPRDAQAERSSEWISERLLARLRHLALAYELPLLARLPTDGELVGYPDVQLRSLEDELAFLFDIVSDKVLLDAVAPFQAMIKRALHDPRGWTLVVETQ
jgi:hypothetical protein